MVEGIYIIWGLMLAAYVAYVAHEIVVVAKRNKIAAEAALKQAAEHRAKVAEAIVLYNYGAREEAKQLLEGTPYGFGDDPNERKTEHSR